MFKILKDKLRKVVETFSKKVEEKKEEVVRKVSFRKIEEADVESVMDEVEISLLEADVSLEFIDELKDFLKEELVGKEVKRKEVENLIRETIRKFILESLQVPRIDLKEVIEKAKREGRPALILFFGVNGVGKSLTLAKISKKLREEGFKPLLAAGDTFRAAGDVQLEVYASRLQLPIIKQKRGADSCAVIFDAREAAKARGYDVVLGDTSGRMHTSKNLMEELRKICRVNKPDLKVLVLDSLTGNDVITQLEFFEEAVGVDAIVFTKVDVNEKGGNILSVCHKYKKPILFLGVGQEFDDLKEFNPSEIAESLL